MTRAIPALLCLLVLYSCAPPKKEDKVETVEAPPFEIKSVRLESRKGCKEDTVACATYEIIYPVFNALPTAANDSITAAIKQVMDAGDPATAGLPIDSVASAFIRDYKDFLKEFPESPMTWYFDGQVEVDSMSEKLICLVASTNYFTGGAHGGYGTYFINVDPTTGKRITLKDVFKSGYEEPLREVGERIFDHLYMSDSTAGEEFEFEFPEGMFTLNDNYGFTKDGIQFTYNIYEIAPYVAGSQDILIPYAEVKTWLKGSH